MRMNGGDMEMMRTMTARLIGLSRLIGFVRHGEWTREYNGGQQVCKATRS